MFRFDPEGITDSMTIDFTGNGTRAWRESDVLHVRVNGIRDGVSDTTTLILTGTAGVAGTIYIVPQQGGNAPPPYVISAADLPGVWSGIDTVDVISGFSVASKGKIQATTAEISISFDAAVESAMDTSLQLEFEASITDADGDVSTDQFVVAATPFDNSALSTPQTIVGSSGSDVILGGSGADVIIGGLGADTLIGGAGADTFQYQSLQDLSSSAPGEVERILDFSSVDGDMVDFGALLNNASNLTNTISIDNTDGQGSRSLLTIASDGETYQLIVDNSNPIPEGESAFYKELDSQTLLGMSNSPVNTSAAWTDVVEVRGTYGGSGPDGWTFKILQPEGGDEVIFELDAEGRRVVFKNSNGDVVSDVHVEITQDGMTHEIQNVDEIKWIV
jgi:Ca2+-binding RTX toxin-like protein